MNTVLTSLRIKAPKKVLPSESTSKWTTNHLHFFDISILMLNVCIDLCFYHIWTKFIVQFVRGTLSIPGKYSEWIMDNSDFSQGSLENFLRTCLLIVCKFRKPNSFFFLIAAVINFYCRDHILYFSVTSRPFSVSLLCYGSMVLSEHNFFWIPVKAAAYFYCVYTWQFFHSHS